MIFYNDLLDLNIHIDDIIDNSEPSDYYFNISDYVEKTTYITICPKVFYDRNGYLYNSNFLLEVLREKDYKIAYSAVLKINKSVNEVKEELIKLGFIENKKI